MDQQQTLQLIRLRKRSNQQPLLRLNLSSLSLSINKAMLQKHKPSKRNRSCHRASRPTHFSQRMRTSCVSSSSSLNPADNWWMRWIWDLRANVSFLKIKGTPSTLQAKLKSARRLTFRSPSIIVLRPLTLCCNWVPETRRPWRPTKTAGETNQQLQPGPKFRMLSNGSASPNRQSMNSARGDKRELKSRKDWKTRLKLSKRSDRQYQKIFKEKNVRLR